MTIRKRRVTTIHKPPEEYFVAVTRKGQPPGWRWEIHRQPKPMGVRLYEEGFKTEFAARLAGEKALQQLLSKIGGGSQQ